MKGGRIKFAYLCFFFKFLQTHETQYKPRFLYNLLRSNSKDKWSFENGHKQEERSAYDRKISVNSK